jgi:3D (Asp-Asp-Asp) domain-containing protein
MKKMPIRAFAYVPFVAIFLLMLCLFSLVYYVKPTGIPAGYRVIHKGVVVATAYNSLPGQTDGSPWTTASGTRCREGVIASNHLPIGTKVMIEGFEGKVFTVEDRMNKRYNKRIDIWFRHYNDAKNFGVRKVKYIVLAAV